MDFKDKWDALSPKQKQQITLGGGAVLIFGFLWIFMFSGEQVQLNRDRPDPVSKSVLTGSNIRELGIDALEGKLTRLERENNDLRTTVKKQEQKIDRLNEKEPRLTLEDMAEIREQVARDLQGNLTTLEQRMTRLARDQQARSTKVNPFAIPEDRPGGIDLPNDAPEPIQGEGSPVPPGADATLDGGKTPFKRSDRQVNPTAGPQRQARAMPGSGAQTSRTTQADGDASDTGGGFGGVRVIRSTEKKPEKTDTKALEDAKKLEMFLPAGSIISGVLLTGVDAPTGELARKDPLPVLLRINKEAILPSKYSADFRECMIIASGYGDLSSSRAMLRSNSLSCIRQDGGVIEVPLYAHAVGEDGKIGIRGELVDKAGEAMRYAMFAGTLEGLAGFFQKTPIPSLSTSGSGAVQYQSLFNSDSFQAAGAQGVGKALDKLTDYWIARADKLVPVVEVDNGRSIDFVVVTGSKVTTIN